MKSRKEKNNKNQAISNVEKNQLNEDELQKASGGNISDILKESVASPIRRPR